ncbi:MAG: RNA polymerase sigma factor [Eubacterium sp.]|nr:RNA polymerase sigma factor [Eubacterium sp.]
MDIEEQYDKIYRYCYFKLYDKQLAQDITQETFLRFYRQDLRLEHSKELPYLYTIAKNLCVDEFRKKPKESIEELADEAACDGLEELLNRLTLKSAIEKLPTEEQELLFLRYVNEAPIASICKIMEISRFTVYRRLSKSLKWLKEELKKEGFSE